MLLQSLSFHNSLCFRQFPGPRRTRSSLGVGGASFVCQRLRGLTLFASPSEGLNPEKKRKVIDHICLLKAKKELSDDDQKDMLDYLYTTQYQMPGILAVSVGCISNKTEESYTHGVFMRFQKKEDVSKFYENPFYLQVLQKHVSPYCHESMNVDYETEVEDDILSIFRKGEEFNYGVEFVHLFKFEESSLGGAAEDALASLENLAQEFPSLIVQFTRGSNFNLISKEYTHGVVIRFRSLEAFNMFVGSTNYRDWETSLCKADAEMKRTQLEEAIRVPNMLPEDFINSAGRMRFKLEPGTKLRAQD